MLIALWEFLRLVSLIQFLTCFLICLLLKFWGTCCSFQIIFRFLSLVFLFVFQQLSVFHFIQPAVSHSTSPLSVLRVMHKCCSLVYSLEAWLLQTHTSIRKKSQKSVCCCNSGWQSDRSGRKPSPPFHLEFTFQADFILTHAHSHTLYLIYCSAKQFTQVMRSGGKGGREGTVVHQVNKAREKDLIYPSCLNGW